MTYEEMTALTATGDVGVTVATFGTSRRLVVFACREPNAPVTGGGMLSLLIPDTYPPATWYEYLQPDEEAWLRESLGTVRDIMAERKSVRAFADEA